MDKKKDLETKGATGEPAPIENPIFTGSFSHNRLQDSEVGESSFAEGQDTIASGIYSHAEGFATEALGNIAHAEGVVTAASGEYSHAEGYGTEALGDCAHASGSCTVAKRENAFACGYITKATNFNSMAIGRFNRPMENSRNKYDYMGDVFVIGIGTSETKTANALRVTYGGEVLGLGAFLSTGADYAEYIYQWEDGNPNNEDRIGYFVTVTEQRIRIAQEGDYIAGIVSGAPSIVGSGDEDWLGRYERDEFNRIVMEDMPEVTEKRDENGKVIFDKITKKPIFVETGKIIPKGRMKQVSNYDPAKKYIRRMERPEWDYIGMLGVISVRDDGTCIPGKFCKCGKGGVATLSETRSFDTYMVIERVTSNVVKVILK